MRSRNSRSTLFIGAKQNAAGKTMLEKVVHLSVFQDPDGNRLPLRQPQRIEIGGAMLSGKTEMLIRRPVAQVFEAFVDPAVTSKFWFSGGSGKLEIGKTVRWIGRCTASA
jgi:hypothetical protein